MEAARPRTTPPLCELDTLAVCVLVAGQLAAKGDVEHGYTTLAAGCGRAAEARQAGEAWADELDRLYRLIMDYYAVCYGVARE